ncbi:MAG TPA: tripartite tricarboxylate transporter permease [Candidatus Limnocylindria bacterium]|nr:tripartite tricarboxylate transporter permease [Candidatus Limnocylindria bacterium]
MDVLGQLALGFSIAVTPQNLLFAFAGALIGTMVGILPGIGPAAGIALLLPVTFGLPPVSSLIMLAGIYYGSMYGGTLTSVLINTPGESASVATTFDGYRMALQGRAGAALGIAAIGSFLAGTLGVIALMLAAPPLADLAVMFGPPEYFALAALGLLTIAGLGGGSALKALISAIAGLALATVGSDPLLGSQRFTFGVFELYDGLEFLPVAVGLFGIAEVFVNLAERVRLAPIRASFSGLIPSWADWVASRGAMLRGGIVGFAIGVLPGAGATIASFVSYGLERRISKHPERFGKGAIEGVAAPESANNAATAGAMVPLLALGIPGSATTAVLLAAFILYGLRPGPLLLTEHPEIFWGLIASMYVGNVMLLFLNLPAAPLFASLLRLPYSVIAAGILGISLAGAYSLNNSIFDIWVALAFGVLGYAMKRLGFPAAPLILALVLGPLLEMSLRQSLTISHGSLAIFATRPASAVLLLIGLLGLTGPALWRLLRRPNRKGVTP